MSFYGGWYSNHDVVRTARAGLNTTLDLPHLIDSLVGIARQMHFLGATLLWPEHGLLVSKGGYGSTEDSARSWHIPVDGTLARQLTTNPRPRTLGQLQAEFSHSGNGTPEDKISLLQSLSPTEQILLKDDSLRASIWLPLVSKGTLQGAKATKKARNI